MTAATVVTAPAEMAPLLASAADRVGALRRTWPWLLVATAFFVYAVAGLSLLTDGFAIGDAVVRSANARTIVFGRDPHVAAIGFVWLPLPVLVQLPLVALLEAAGWSAASGVLSSAAAAALTVPVIVSFGRHAGASERMNALVVASTALNPVTVLWAASGMSESLAVLLITVVVTSFLRWWVVGDLRSIAVTGLAGALAALTRYEVLGILVVVALAAALRGGRGRRAAAATAVLFPAAAVFGLWLAMSHVLVGDALHWVEGMRATTSPGPDAWWLPAGHGLGAGLPYVVERVVRFAPSFLLLVPLTVWTETRAAAREGRRWAPSVGVVIAAALVVPAYVAMSIASGSTFGNARYFVVVIPMAAVAALWFLGRSEPRITQGPVGWLLVVLIVAGSVTGTLSALDRRVSAVESEDVAMRVILGLQPGSSSARGFDVKAWKATSRWIDANVGAGELLLADSTTAFPALQFVAAPAVLLTSEDRDFDRLVATDPLAFSWVLDTPPQAGRRGVSNAGLIADVLDSPPPGSRWEHVYRSSVASVYLLQEDA